MALRAQRDWRGARHQLSEYSTGDLIGLLSNAEHTQRQVAAFAARVGTELARRGTHDQPTTVA